MLDSMKRIVSAALVAAAAILAVSCGNGNGTRNDGKGEGAQSAGIESAVFSLSYSVTEDVLRIADVNIEFVGADGTVSVHDVGEEGWKCDLEASQLPATVSFRPLFALLDGVAAADSYRLGTGYSVSVAVRDASGAQKVVYSSSSPQSDMTLKADKAAEWVARQNSASRAHSYTVDAQGTVQAR